MKHLLLLTALGFWALQGFAQIGGDNVYEFVNLSNAARDPIRLTHGPMLGNIQAGSVNVWGRTSDPGQFEVRYGTHPDKMDQRSKPTPTKLENDNTGFTTLNKLKSIKNICEIYTKLKIDIC